VNLGIISMQNEGGHMEFNERRDNQNPYLEEEQTMQWPKENVQKDKQRST
jgi:hypothetical protein